MNLKEYKKIVSKITAPNFEGGVRKLRKILVKHWMWVYDIKGGEYANLSDANLSDANLVGANLRYANLIGADLSWVNLSGADLSYADLSGADPVGADLSYANLRYANLIGADLSDANLIDADLIGAVGIKKNEKSVEEPAELVKQTQSEIYERMWDTLKAESGYRKTISHAAVLLERDDLNNTLLELMERLEKIAGVK